MKLIVVHQILITAALSLALLFAVRALVLFARARQATDLVMGVVAMGVAAALGTYLPKVRARARAERDAQRRP